MLACPDCDLLQRHPPLPAGAVAQCGRCGAVVARGQLDNFGRVMPITLTAIILFVIANTFPVVGLEVNGNLVQTTLYGAALALVDDQMPLLAVLVVATAILAPAVELAATAYVVWTPAERLDPDTARLAMAALHAARPWSMVEVFTL